MTVIVEVVEMNFGEKYVIRGEIRKDREVISSKNHVNRYTLVTWEQREFEDKNALFIGWRYVKEGTYYPGSYDESHRFVTQRRIRVALFVVNQYTNPIYVHPDQILTNKVETRG